MDRQRLFAPDARHYARLTSKSRTISLRLAAAALMVTALLVGGAPLSASAPRTSTETGWWHRALTDLSEGTTAPLDIPDDARPTTTDVPDGGLYVANDASGPRAVSAVRVDDTSAPNGVLTLQLADRPTMPLGARLVACPATSPWEPATNGQWKDRPHFDCRTSAEGHFVDDLTSIEFVIADLEPYTSSRGIEFGIGPAAGESAPFAIAFEPIQDALGPAQDPQRNTDDGGDRPPPPTSSFEGPPARGGGQSAEPQPVADASPTTTEVSTRQSATSATGSPSLAASDPGLLRIGTNGTARAVIVAVLALFAASTWLLSGRLPALHEGTNREEMS